MSKPRIMLLFDFSHGGFGDVTNLLRIGRFLVSKGYPVFSTIIPTFSSQIEDMEANATLILQENDIIPCKVYHPTGFAPSELRMKESDYAPDYTLRENISSSVKISNRLWHSFLPTRNIVNALTQGYGISLRIITAIQAIRRGLDEDKSLEYRKSKVEEIIALIQHETVTSTQIDYEIAVYGARSFASSKPRILITQHSDEGLENTEKRGGKFDFIISPVPPRESGKVLQAGFHTHTNYTVLPRKDVIKLLLKNESLTTCEDHLQKSSWGTYYSGTLGTNGLFFKRLLSALPSLLRKHGKITYFTFQDKKHFERYVLRFLKGKPVGIINLVDFFGSHQIIQDFSDKDVLFINIQTSTDFMEAIVNCCSLCSVCAGDSSFNILANHLNHDHSFAFFKYFNFNQKYFFQYLINAIHEFETKYKLGHEVSRCLFAFGYYEKLFRHYHHNESSAEKFIDECKLLESERTEGWNVLGKLSRTREDFRLIERLFYDGALAQQCNLIMRGLPAFIKERDGLESVEDVLLSILEGRIKK